MNLLAPQHPEPTRSRVAGCCGGWWAPWIHLSLIGIILFATMPTSAIRGDPLAIRIEAAQLLVTGSLGIQYEERESIAPFVSERGQFFYENDESGRFYSKYGILNTLLFVPPLAAYRALTGEINALDWSGPFVFLLNLYHIGLGLAVAALLYRIVRRHSDSGAACWAFVYGSLFGTFLWYYLRAQSSEVFQVLFFLLAYDGWVSSRRAETAAAAYFAAAVAGLAVSALVLLKAYYGLLVPIGLGWYLIPAGRSSRRTAALAAAFVAMAGIGLLVLAATNQVKFGSPFETGYGQFASDRFSAFPQIDALRGFLFRPDRSVLIHFPLFGLAVIGAWFADRIMRVEWCLALAALGAVYLVVSCFNNWPGHWSYGPRYLLFALPVASLPAICVIERAVRARRRILRGLAVAALGAGMAWAVSCQLAMNRLPFFVFYDLQSLFAIVGDSDINRYFRNRNFVAVHRHLLAWREGSGSFPPLEMARALRTPEQQEQLSSIVRTMLWPNFFWLQATSQTEPGGTRPGLPAEFEHPFPPRLDTMME